MSSLETSFDLQIGPIVKIGIAGPKSFAGTQTRPFNLVKANALVDTGASRTSITAEVARRAKLPIMGKRPVSTFDGLKSLNCYYGDVLLYFDSKTSELTPEIQLVECAPNSPHFEALLGRDVLCKFDLRMTKDHKLVLTL